MRATPGPNPAVRAAGAAGLAEGLTGGCGMCMACTGSPLGGCCWHAMAARLGLFASRPVAHNTGSMMRHGKVSQAMARI